MNSKETLSEAWRRESDELLRQGQEGAVQHCVALAMGVNPALRADLDLHRAAAVKLLWRGARAGEASTKVLRLPYDGVGPEEEQKFIATFGREAADSWWVTAETAHHEYRIARLLLGEEAAAASNHYGTPRWVGGESTEEDLNRRLAAWHVGDPLVRQSEARIARTVSPAATVAPPPKRQPPIPWEYIAGCLTREFDCEVGPELPNGTLVVRHYAKDWQARVRPEDCPETMDSLSHGLGIAVGNLRWAVKCYRKQVQARQLQAERIQRAASEGREDYSQANIQEAAAQFMAEHGKPELIESGSMPCRNASALRPDQRDLFVREWCRGGSIESRTSASGPVTKEELVERLGGAVAKDFEREVVFNPPRGETFEAWQARTNLAAMTAEEIVYASDMGFLPGLPPGSCSAMGRSAETFNVPPEAVAAPADFVPVQPEPAPVVTAPTAAMRARAAQEHAAIRRAQLAYPTDRGLVDADEVDRDAVEHLAEEAMRQARETLDRPAPPRFPKR